MSPAASVSSSAIVADGASGCHHLKIEDYSTLKVLPTGHRLSSCPFTIGGHRWIIDCYPNGIDEESAGHVSVYLALDDDVTGKVTASFRFRFEEAEEKPWLSFLNKAILGPQQSPAGLSFSGKRSWGIPAFAKWEALEQSRHLNKDDSFTIRCDIVVVNGYKVRNDADEKPAPDVVLVPPSDLSQHLSGLLLSEKGADVVFEAGGETFAAHRCVLAARSPVFSAELVGSMKEGRSTNDLVRVDGMEAEVFKALLCFVYTDSLPEMKEEEEGTMCQHLLVAADTYGMERLKLICEDKLCKYIDVGTVAYILALAEAHHCHVLKKVCFGFLGRKANLMAVMASDGFEHLIASCPTVVKELSAMHLVT